MKTYTLSDLSNRSGEVMEAASRAPISISKRGRARYVIMANEDFERLATRGADPRRVFSVAQPPPDLADEFRDGLEALLDRLTRD